jgi:uncharacterized membrane protein required for colicin V production
MPATDGNVAAWAVIYATIRARILLAIRKTSVATAEVILITVIALFVVLPGIAGVIRGTLRSLLALLGMLLGAVLVDGWQRSWQNWIEATVNTADPAMLTWAAMAAAFLAVFLFIGYGAPLLLPRRMLPERLTLSDRLLGLLIGLVTGLLVASYLLHYAALLRPDTPVMGVIDRSLVAQITWASLPWVMLALVVLMALIILGRAFVGPAPKKKAATQEEPPPVESQPGRADEGARTTDTETFEPTPLPGTRPLPNDETEERYEPPAAQTEDVPPPDARAEEPDTREPGEAAPPSSPAKDDDERDDSAAERR